MNLIQRMIYAPGAASGLCSTCVWGTVRKGHRSMTATPPFRNEEVGFCICFRRNHEIGETSRISP